MISNEVKIQAGSVLGIAGLMTWLNCRPLGIIFFTILIVFSYKQLYPNARVQIPYEVQNNLKSLINNFAELRKDKPGAFCVIISAGLVTLAIAGSLISGTWLVMGTLIGILFLCAKYKVKLVHGEISGQEDDDDVSKKFDDTGEVKRNPPWSGSATDYEVPDEFLPDVSDDFNTSLLKQVAEDADVSNYLYKTNTSKTTGDEDKEDSDSEVPSDLLLTSDKIPEIEDEEVTFPSGFSPMDSPMDIELPRTHETKVIYDPFAEGIEFKLQHQPIDDSSDSDDSISRGLNFQDVSLPDASGSGAKGIQLTSSGSGSFQHDLGRLPLSKSTSSSHHQDKEFDKQKNISPTWNIVNNLWDAVNSSVVPSLQQQQQKLLPQSSDQPAIISTTVEERPSHASLQTHRKSVTAELSSDESDFELLDTDDLNINT
uniref:CSON003112 protein n=1 Tax=Culicoides sonorensis TaxID=179676 RepID=A0A336LSW4_CULSO